MHLSKSVRPFACVSLAIALALSVGSAQARPEIPGELQEVAGMRCVPLCTMCHATNPGVKTNWQPTKPLAANLVGPITAETSIKDAYNAWAAANPTLVPLVKNGVEPSTGQDVCGPTYGCTVRIEKEAAAPRDFSGPLWVVGAMVVGAVLRRRRKPAR